MHLAQILYTYSFVNKSKRKHETKSAILVHVLYAITAIGNGLHNKVDSKIIQRSVLLLFSQVWNAIIKKEKISKMVGVIVEDMPSLEKQKETSFIIYSSLFLRMCSIVYLTRF